MFWQAEYSEGSFCIDAFRRRRAIGRNRRRLLAGLAGITETDELRKVADQSLNTRHDFVGELADALVHRAGAGREIDRVE